MALSDYFSPGKDISSYWNPPTNFSNTFDPSAFTTKLDFSKYGIDTNTDTSSYWNPKGDKAGFPWSQALQAGARMAGTEIAKYRQKLQEGQQVQQGSDRQSSAFATAPGAGWSSQQLLPNLSSLQYTGPTVQMAGVQGGPGFLDTPAGKALLGVGTAALGAFAGPALGALGSALSGGAGAGLGAAGSAAGSAAFGAGGAAFNPAAFTMGSFI